MGKAGPNAVARRKCENVVKALWVWTLASERTTEELDEMTEHLNAGLDALRDQDFFGTENQMDPRGETR
jgi:hypothetical protein